MDHLAWVETQAMTIVTAGYVVARLISVRELAVGACARTGDFPTAREEKFAGLAFGYDELPSVYWKKRALIVESCSRSTPFVDTFNYKL